MSETTDRQALEAQAAQRVADILRAAASWGKEAPQALQPAVRAVCIRLGEMVADQRHYLAPLPEPQESDRRTVLGLVAEQLASPATTKDADERSQRSLCPRQHADDGGPHPQAPAPRAQTVRQLKNAVKRDLEWLLNNRRIAEEPSESLRELSRQPSAKTRPAARAQGRIGFTMAEFCPRVSARGNRGEFILTARTRGSTAKSNHRWMSRPRDQRNS